jgi:hypothetical protein
MIRITSILVILISTICSAQEPFLKFSSPKFLNCGDWSDSAIAQNSEPRNHETTIAMLFCVYKNRDTLSIAISQGHAARSVKFDIYRNSRLIQSFDNDPIDYNLAHWATEPIAVTDFNNDGLIDFRIDGVIFGADTYGGGTREFYFLQNKQGLFTKLSFFTKLDVTERDIDNDSVFAVVPCQFERTNGHSYWIYGLYKFTSDDLVDIADAHNYPVFVQELFRPNHVPAKDIPSSIRLQFHKPKPPEFVRDLGKTYAQ